MGTSGKIVLLHETLAPLMPMLMPAFEVVKLWDYPDFTAMMAAEGGAIQIIASLGGT